MSLSSDDIARHYRKEARRMFGFFVRRTHDPEVALDLVAETFAAAIRDRAQFGGRSDEAAVAWLYGIGRNLLGAARRVGRRRPDSNRSKRLCRPLRSHSATAPGAGQG